jgi:hypothetical protein
LIVLAAVLAVIVAVGALAVTGVVHVPFIGKQKVTEGDPEFGWTLEIPTRWTANAHSFTGTDVRFRAEGSGVGVQVRAQRFFQEIPPDEVRKDQLVQQVKPVINDASAQLTIVDGPTFGTINGVPYVKYLYTYFAPLNGVQSKLEHSQYHFFNGANVEEVTYETLASQYAKNVADIEASIKTFHSAHLTPVPTPSTSPGH